MAEDLKLKIILETGDAEKQLKSFASQAADDIEKVNRSSSRAADGIRAAAGKVQGIGDAIGRANEKFENLGQSIINTTKTAIRLVAAFKIIKAAATSASVAALGGMSLLAQRVPVVGKALEGVGINLRKFAASSPRLAVVGRAMDGVSAAAKDGEKGFQKLNKRATFFGRTGIFIKNNKEQLLRLAKAALVVGASIGITIAAFGAMAKVAEAAQQRIDLIGSAKIFQVSTQEAENYRISLNDVKTGLEALATVVELRQIGFSEADVARLGTMVNIFAAVTGHSKEAVEQQLKGGQITERQFGIASKLTGELKTRAGLQLHIQKFMLKQNVTSLTQAQLARESMGYLFKTAKAAREIEKNLKKVGEANPFTVFKKQLRTIREDIVTHIAPGILKAFQSVLGIIEKVGKGWAAIFVVIKNGWTKGRAILKEMHKTEIAQAKTTASTLRGISAKTHAKTKAQLKKELDDQRKITRQKEATAEAQSRQSRARALARNFEREALTRIAAFGARGISQTIAGISQLIELSKVLGNNFTGASKSAQLLRLQLQAGSVAAKKLAINEQIQTSSLEAQLSLSQALRAEVQGRAQIADIEAGITGGIKSANAAILVLRKNQNKAAKAGIAQLQKMLAMLSKEAERRKNIVALTIERARIVEKFSSRSKELADVGKLNAILEQQRKIQEKIQKLGGSAAKNQSANVEAIIEKTGIQIQLAQALLQKNVAILKTATDPRSKAILDGRIATTKVFVAELKNRLALEVKLHAATVKADSFATASRQKQIADTARAAKSASDAMESRIAAAKAKLAGGPAPLVSGEALRKTQDQITQLVADIDHLQKKLALLNPASDAASAVAAEIARHALKLSQARELGDVQEEQHEKDKKSMKDKWKFTKQLTKGLVGLATSAASHVGTLFTEMVTKPKDALGNFGASLLQSLGDMAFKIASYYAALGAAEIATVAGAAQGAAMLVAAAGLATVGGLLKGAGAMVRPKNTKPVSGSSPSSGTGPRTGLPGANPGAQREQSNTYILVTNALYGSEEDQIRNLRRKIDRNKRGLGGKAVSF